VDRQRTARIAGIWFSLTFVFSIPGALLYGPALGDHHTYIIETGHDTQLLIGALLEVGVIVANIATALVLYPVLKRQSQAISLGYVASRIVESTMIAVGILMMVALVKLRQDLSGTSGDTTSLVVAGRSLVAVKNASFLLGPSLCAGVGNGILLGYLMYKTGLVPRRMAMIGVVGGPLCAAAALLALVGVYHQNAGIQGVLTVPEIVWEASFALYLTFKGFRSSPFLQETIDLTKAPVPAQRVWDGAPNATV
jgi:hypothetical protein